MIKDFNEHNFAFAPHAWVTPPNSLLKLFLTSIFGTHNTVALRLPFQAYHVVLRLLALIINAAVWLLKYSDIFLMSVFCITSLSYYLYKFFVQSV